MLSVISSVRDIKDLRVWSLLLAISVYMIWGTPTPKGVDVAVLAVGVLLALSVGISGAARVFINEKKTVWEKGAFTLLSYGLSIPVFVGVVMGNGAGDMLRDIIPFLFFLLPLFLHTLLSRHPANLQLLTGAVVILGLAFSLRVLVPYMTGFSDAGMHGGRIDPFLLANAPTVLFSALFLGGMAGYYLYNAALIKSFVCFALSIIALATMAVIMQRASVGVFCMMVVILMAIGMVRRPLRVLLPLCVALVSVAVYWPAIHDVLLSLMHKNSLVGFNMRWQEAMAVIDSLSGSFFHVVFGKGWGANIASPAVGGDVVNFTHSLMTTYWLKAGLIGLGLALFYLFQLGLMVLRLFFVHPVIAMALAGPFLIDIFLYASFKSLDFGLVLLMIVLWAQSYGLDRLDRLRPATA